MAENTTKRMAELYQNGLTLEEVGKKFGITRQGVRDRFIRAGITRRKPKNQTIDKNRLRKLYSDDKMPLFKIAEIFSVSKDIIRRALKFHEIPKRKKIKKGGYKVDFLRKLKINEQKVFEMPAEQ